MPVIRGLPVREWGRLQVILLIHACHLHTVRDHLPLSPGLVSSDKESAAHILSRKGGRNLLSILVGESGVTECQAWSLQAGAAEPQGLHQARPDARLLGRGLWVQMENGKDCSLEGRLQRQVQILFWQAESGVVR